MDFLITLVITLIVVGVLLWLLSICPVIDGEMKSIIRWIVLCVVVLWLLSLLLGYAPPIRLPWYGRR